MPIKKSFLKITGKFVQLPWSKWYGVEVCPDWIKTKNGKLIPPDKLDLLIWKAGVYDRGGDPAHVNDDLEVYYQHEWE